MTDHELGDCAANSASSMSTVVQGADAAAAGAAPRLGRYSSSGATRAETRSRHPSDASGPQVVLNDHGRQRVASPHREACRLIMHKTGAAQTASTNWSGRPVKFTTVKPNVIKSGDVRHSGGIRHVASLGSADR